MKYDAVVVGGSVAGSTTARELGRRGLRVALVEKARFPRFKPCGEGLLPHGTAALEEMGLDVPGVPVRGIRYVSPSGLTAQAEFSSGHGTIVRRDRFDHHLFRAAAATPNVDVFPETAYDPARFEGRWIVGADGLHSQFHRSLPARPPGDVRIGLSTHVRGLRVSPDFVEVVLYDGGELYLGPSEDGDALVALLVWKEFLPPGATNEERMKSAIQAHLGDRVDRLEFTTPCLAVSPLGLTVRRIVADGILLVGDAAGAPDPVTGEGMSLAILSAQEAARAIAEGDPRGYVKRRKKLAASSEWLSRWILRAGRRPKVADRVVAALADKPPLFRKLLDIAVGADVSYVELARLVL